MTSEEYPKICRICENRRHDYEHGMVCRLTNRKADFEDKCPSFVLDKEALIQTQNVETFSENTDYDMTKEGNYSENGFTWQALIGIILAIIGVIRFLTSFN